jgi:hypothetical protein
LRHFEHMGRFHGERESRQDEGDEAKCGKRHAGLRHAGGVDCCPGYDGRDTTR